MPYAISAKPAIGIKTKIKVAQEALLVELAQAAPST
jgi:hypothetical protein